MAYVLPSQSTFSSVTHTINEKTASGDKPGILAQVSQFAERSLDRVDHFLSVRHSLHMTIKADHRYACCHPRPNTTRFPPATVPIFLSSLGSLTAPLHIPFLSPGGDAQRASGSNHNQHGTPRCCGPASSRRACRPASLYPCSDHPAYWLRLCYPRSQPIVGVLVCQRSCREMVRRLVEFSDPT